ncbi:type III-A CRISPR-associated RAMP protein Csm3 [Saccharolobus caldissimus]|uniref:CRISPR system Cms endoribonuclease Csm3 n=1 Tax=Saccharolobus caldissimus TaxID=1702097 RepID=A0AAQ4CRX7_9CREN|nr:type III-A CRISPR-associated RAMP protein Csm3 [Saccharolobus caldissimus]BDB98558.1 type III-A CRISPR-associated RAMP protein Csm3 [Saccharolobus caldissimus]
MSSQPSISLKLEKIIRFKVYLQTITGLLISAGKALGRIGGADTEPMSIERVYVCDDKSIKVRVPYIPGSSLKGRMRSLLEIALGLPLYSSDKKIWSHTLAKNVYVDLSSEDRLSTVDFVNTLIKTDLDRMFGYGAFPLNEVFDDLKKENKTQVMNSLLAVLSPTSLLVEDLFPEEKYVCEIYKENDLVTFDDFIEDKNENRIDRVTSAADPRTISRVKPGITFTGTLSLLVFDKNSSKLKDYLELLAKGMVLMEKTYLGAAGSRGYGRVKFTKIIVSIYDPVRMTETIYKEFNSAEELSKDIENLVKSITSQQTGVKS